MATESASSQPRGKGKNGRKLVGFDEFIHAQFTKTRGALRSVDVLSALAQWFTAALVFFFAVVMLDHWIVPGGLATWTRWVSLAILVLGSAAYLGFALGVPMLRRISLPYAARTIERSDPSLKNSLINFLDLRRRQEDYSPAVLELVEQQAATDLTHVEVENAVSREGLVKVSYAMLFMVVLGCAYVLLSPKSPFTTFGRVLAPAADISPPTKVTIAEVLPGDAQVFAGDELEVTAATGISDGMTPDRMTLYYTTESHKYVDEPLDMVLVSDRHWRARLRGDSSRSAGLQEDFTYRLHAGDYTTRDYRIKVIQAPSARVERVVYDFPQYTGFERRVLDVGDLDALEGTTVTLTATTNMPVKHGGIDFDGDLKTDLVLTRREDPERKGDRLEGKFVLGFKPDGTPRYERYQVLFETLDGETNPNPILYRIQTRRDYPPTVSIPKPGRDLSWPANKPLLLEIEAEDKDFALRRVILHVSQGRQNLAARDLGVGTDLGRTLSTVHNLDLARFDLQAGDVIQYWAEALDNKEPQANRAESTRYEVRILSPLSPEEEEQQIADASKQIEQQRRQIEESQPDEEGAPGEEMDPEDTSEQGEGDDENSEIESDAETVAKIFEKLRQEHDGEESDASDEQSDGASVDDPQPPQPSESGREQQEPAGAQQEPSENGEDDSADSDEEGRPQEDPSGLPSGLGEPKSQAQADDESSAAEEGGTGQSGQSGSSDQPSEAPPGGSPSSETDSGSDADPQSGTQGSEPSDDPSSADPKPGSSDQPGTESTQPSNAPQESEDEGSEDSTGSDSSKSSDSEETGKGEGPTDSETSKPGADPEAPAQPGTEKPEDAVPQASDKPGETGDSATENEPMESDPQSSSPQTDRSDKQGRDSGNAPGGGKPSPGQQEPQPGKGQEGSGEEGDQGGKPSDQPGQSDATRPGQQKPSDQSTGQGGSSEKPSDTTDPDSDQTEGSQPSDSPESQDGKQPGDASDQPRGDSQASDSSENNSNSDRQDSQGDSSQSDGSANQQEGSGKGKGQSDSPGTGTPEGGERRSGSGNNNPPTQDRQGDQSGKASSPSGGGTGPDGNQAAEAESSNSPDPANEDYAKKATELVLDFLRNHKKQDEIDPELAKELGRTPEQLKKLMERLEKYQAESGKEPESLSPEEAARLRAFEESVRQHGLEASSFERSTTGTRMDPRAVFQGDRSRIPPEYREQYDAYFRSVLRSSKPKSE